MAVQAIEANLQPLHRGIRTARSRFWLQTAIRTVARSICLSLGLALLAALLAAWQVPDPVLNALWAASAAIPLSGLLLALARRPSRSHAARKADLGLGLPQQLGTAEELLATRASGSLVSVQLTRASAMAAELPIRKAFPLVPGRELAAAGALASATATMLFLVSLGLRLPNPLTLISLPELSRETSTSLQQEVLGARHERVAQQSRSLATERLRQMLEDIERQTQAGAMSPLAAAAALAEAGIELNRTASESRVRQDALDSLANELRATASGKEIAETLRQGDFEQAADQLRELGRQSDRLSSAAKREVSDALNRAAMRSQSAQDLARREAQAARTLQGRDYNAAVRSMDQLGQSVEEAAKQLVPQSELADAWQQLEELNQQLGNLGLPKDQSNGQPAPSLAQTPQSAGGQATEGSGEGLGEQFFDGMAFGDEPGPIPGQPTGGNGQPGSMPGANPLGNQNPELGANGERLDVNSQVGDRFPGEPGAEAEEPSVLREGRANSVSSPPTGGADGPISVPAENVSVPGDRRSIVREYFSRESKGQ